MRDIDGQKFKQFESMFNGLLNSAAALHDMRDYDGPFGITSPRHRGPATIRARQLDAGLRKTITDAIENQMTLDMEELNALWNEIYKEWFND